MNKKALMIYLNNYVPNKIINLLKEHNNINIFQFLDNEILKKYEEIAIDLNMINKYNEEKINKFNEIIESINNFIDNNLEDNCIVVLEKGPFYINYKIYEHINEVIKNKKLENIEIVEDLV